MMATSKAVHIRIESDLLKRIDHLCADFDLFRTDAIEMLLETAMNAIENDEWDAEELVDEFFDEDEDEEEADE